VRGRRGAHRAPVAIEAEDRDARLEDGLDQRHLLVLDRLEEERARTVVARVDDVLVLLDPQRL
jgi:hypothetical protein